MCNMQHTPQAGPLQTKEFLSLDAGPTGWTLGLKLYMHKHYFQLPELRLKCVATYHDIIKEYQSQVNIISKSFNELSIEEAQSTSQASSPHLLILWSLTSLLLLSSSSFIHYYQQLLLIH